MTQTIDPGSEALSEYRRIELSELLATHDVVDVVLGDTLIGSSPYIVVGERPSGGRSDTVKFAERGSPNLSELGYTSMSPWTAWTREEKIPQLRDKLGIRQWYDMKRNDGTVRGALGLLKTPIRAARWFVQPGGEASVDEKAADLVRRALFEETNVDWAQILDDILLCFDYGYMPMEKVWKFNKKGEVMLRKLAPRHPLDIREWVYDDKGGPAGIVMEPFVPYGNQRSGGISMGEFIPIDKLAIFTLEAEAGDLRGISVLRSAYKHWYYKDTLYKIDAIQKERHGIGIPVIKLPPGFSEADKQLADDLGRNLRTNDRAHIVIPANWEILFAKLEGQPVDCIKSIEHHNAQIHANIIAPFMNEANPGVDSVDMFFKSTRYLAAQLGAIINKFIIPELVDFNFPRAKYPKLTARRIGEWNDLRTWSFAFRNLVGSSAIIPDDPLEEFLREELDLPKPDPTTARIVETPQGPEGDGEGGDEPGDANVPGKPKPGRAGSPRQKSAGPFGNPKGNAGRDGSGG